MDAYLLGRHSNDLPVHLLQEGEPGNRIRAVARLEGPEQDVLYAIETPDHETVATHSAKVGSAGTMVTHTLIPCLSPPCLVGISHPNGNPLTMPPYRFCAFIWLETDQCAAAVELMKQKLGDDGIYAATDGEGHTFVQLGSDDSDLLRSAAAEFVDAAGGAASGPHLVAQTDIIRA